MDLARGGWGQDAFDALSSLLCACSQVRGRPFVVFDWDNTSIAGDCADALFRYQLRHMAFAMDAKAFERLFWDLPEGPISPVHGQAEADGIGLQDLAADLSEDYDFLWGNPDRLGSPRHHSFYARMVFFSEALCATHGYALGYPWVNFLLAGFLPSEVDNLAERSHDAALLETFGSATWTAESGTRTKDLTVTFSAGVRVQSELQNLMSALQCRGVDVFISTASPEVVVRQFACNPKYGYGLRPQSVLGVKLDSHDGRYRPVLCPGRPWNWGPGKTQNLETLVVHSRGEEPILVAGDSEGDAWMLQDFGDMRVGILFGSAGRGRWTDLVGQALSGLGKPDSKYFLQSREPRTGRMISTK